MEFRITTGSGCYVEEGEHENDLLTMDEEILLNLADDMASAMSSLNSQNYKTFIDARDKLRNHIKNMVSEYQQNHDRIKKIKKVVQDF